MTDEQSWQERRRETAGALGEALRRRQAAESEQARRMLAEFVEQAMVDGPPPVELRARSYDGRQRYRTPLRGWYLRQNETVAVDTDGQFYVLSVPPSLRAMFQGARPDASDPPLVLGKGARDGESIDLADALRLLRERARPGDT